MTLNQKFITAVKEWKESAIFLLIKLSGAVSCSQLSHPVLYFNNANLWGSMERQGGMSSVQPCRVEQLCNSEQHDLTFKHIVGCSGRTVLSMFSHIDYAEEANRGNMARYLIKNKSLACPSCTRSTQTWSRKWEILTRASSDSARSAMRDSLKTVVREKTHTHTQLVSVASQFHSTFISSA